MALDNPPMVLNETALGYVYEHNWRDGSASQHFQVLAKLGPGGHDPRQGCDVIMQHDTLRPATHDDFERFRVDSKYHLPNRYEDEALF